MPQRRPLTHSHGCAIRGGLWISRFADWSACQQILERTNTQRKIPQALYASTSAETASGLSESDPSAARLSSDPANYARRGAESSVSKLTKDKDKK